MNENEGKYLNEEKYQKAERKISLASIVILIIGLCVGGFLIYNGIAKPSASKIADLKNELETKKSELESKGITYDEFAEYADGEKYNLKVITDVLDPSFNNCKFDEYKNNDLTKEYCVAKNTGGFASKSSIMFGVFICVATCMTSFAIFMFAKRRKVLAFTAQQVMPIAQEGIEKMAPTMGNAAGEIAKGIKNGLNDSNKDKE